MWEDYMDYFAGGIPGSEFVWVLVIILGSAIALLTAKKMISEL